MARSIQIGVVGYGTVGHGVVHGLLDRKKLIQNRTGLDVELRWVCDRGFAKNKKSFKGKTQSTHDVQEILQDDQVDIVVELVGGVDAAKSIVLDALKAGKHVVTANKALMATAGKELFKQAKKSGVELYFEAAVGGGIPIIKGLREGLVDNYFNAIVGILNGTSNYILTQMRQQGWAFQDALKEAQSLGYAEKDPTLDVGGHDAAHKLALLAWLGYGLESPPKNIHTEGIEHIEPVDIENAAEMGYFIKHLAIAKRVAGGLEVRVHPALVHKHHLMANVEGVFNAVYVNGDRVGDQLFYGKGAGEKPTASAVIADIVDIAKKMQHASNDADAVVSAAGVSGLSLCKMGDVVSRYYLRFTVTDKPGVLAKITGILGDNEISIASVRQQERNQKQSVAVIIVTHEAKESDIKKSLTQVDRSAFIDKKTIVIRIEDSTEDLRES